MEPTFGVPSGLTPGRIAHVVYRVDGDTTSRTVTTGVDENVSEAIRRELVRMTGVPVEKTIVLATGSTYEYHFVSGETLRVSIL